MPGLAAPTYWPGLGPSTSSEVATSAEAHFIVCFIITLLSCWEVPNDRFGTYKKQRVSPSFHPPRPVPKTFSRARKPVHRLPSHRSATKNFDIAFRLI